MKILYYSPHPNLNLSDPAGYGTHMREMIAAFRRLGHEVHPVIMGGTEPPPGPPPKPSMLKRLARRIIPKKRWQTLKDRRLLDFDDEAYERLAKEVKAFGPDMIYERGNYMQVSGVNAARKHRVMHVLEMNSPYVEEKVELEGESGLRAEAEALERQQMEKSTHVVTVSSALKDYFMEKHGIYAGKFTVLPNAIRPEQGETGPATIAKLRKMYGLEGRQVIGWVGSVQPWHGIDRLIAAFAGLADRHPDAALLLVGGGETIGELRKQAADSGYGERIVFTGYVPHGEVFAHIALMDVCVLAHTKWYCSPIKIFEYGLMGKPVIATDHAAVLDVMVPDVDGLIIEPGREALQNAMDRLTGDAKLRGSLGAKFREKVLQQHTWEANARRVIDIWESEQATIPRQ